MFLSSLRRFGQNFQCFPSAGFTLILRSIHVLLSRVFSLSFLNARFEELNMDELAALIVDKGSCMYFTGFLKAFTHLACSDDCRQVRRQVCIGSCCMEKCAQSMLRLPGLPEFMHLKAGHYFHQPLASDRHVALIQHCMRSFFPCFTRGLGRGQCTGTGPCKLFSVTHCSVGPL